MIPVVSVFDVPKANRAEVLVVTEGGSWLITGIGAVVSICRMPAGLELAAPDKSATLPAPSVTVAPFRLKDVTVRSGVFWPA